MKSHKTVFDHGFPQEDLTYLAKELQLKQRKESKMLLRAYSTEIFEPRDGEIPNATMSEIDALMTKTQKARKRIKGNQRILSFVSPKLLAYAASVIIVCSLAFFLVNKPTAETGTGIAQNTPFDGGKFRGGNHGDNSAVLVAENDPKLEPLAYLVDAQGQIEIKRSQKTIQPTTSCEVLYAGDVVALKEQAKAKVMYEDAFFDITGEAEYQIASPSPLKVAAGNMRQVIEPSFTTRGAGYTNPVKTVALPPKMLLAQIVAPVTRDGKESINVYSPKGASFTKAPQIHIGGDSASTYTVEVLDLAGDTIGKPIQLKGNSTAPWSAITSSPLEQDEIYSLKVTMNGKIVNDANNSNFWLVSKEDADRIQEALARFDKLDSQEAKEFFKANTLFVNGCYAETRALALKLTRANPQNHLFSSLVNLCNQL